MNDKKNYVYFENLLPRVLSAAQKKPPRKTPPPDPDPTEQLPTSLINSKADCEKVIGSDNTKT